MLERANGVNGVNGAGPNGHHGGPLAPNDRNPEYDIALQALGAVVTGAVTAEAGDSLNRGEIARIIGRVVSTYLAENNVLLDLIERRDLVAALLPAYAPAADQRPPPAHPPIPPPPPHPPPPP